MAPALTVVIGLLAGLGLLGAAAYLVGAAYHVERFPDEIHFATTVDGWRVALVRYRPAAGAGSAVPVVLVHGIGANRLNLDLTDDRSLARALAVGGHDVWLVELRGRGLSTCPRLFSRFRYDWSFDEYVDQDLPAALATIRRATGVAELHLVGFSLGAMALYPMLADPARAAEVRSAVLLAAPVRFRFQRRYLRGRLIRNLRWLRHRWWMRTLAPLAAHGPLQPLRLVLDPDNVEGPVQRRAMVNAAANFARDELLQLGDWILHDAFRSVDHRRDYRGELGGIVAPVLWIAGARDLLAPPDAVKTAYDAAASTDKRFVIAGRAGGFSANYGHLDLVLGRRAAEEIFPLVRGWIDAHGGRTVAAASADEPGSDEPGGAGGGGGGDAEPRGALAG